MYLTVFLPSNHCYADDHGDLLMDTQINIYMQTVPFHMCLKKASRRIKFWWICYPPKFDTEKQDASAEVIWSYMYIYIELLTSKLPYKWKYWWGIEFGHLAIKT